MTRCVQVSTTLETEAAAADLAEAVVGERLAACVQVTGPIRSVYRWEGNVETAGEWLCTAKTTDARLPALIARIRALHPYRQPEIVATPIVGGDPGYLDWIREETTP